MPAPRDPTTGRFLCVPAYPRLRTSKCGCAQGADRPCPVGQRLAPHRAAAKAAFAAIPRTPTPEDVRDAEEELFVSEREREALASELDYVRAQIKHYGSTHHRLGSSSFETHDARFGGKHGGQSYGAGVDNSEMAYKELLAQRAALRAHDAHLATRMRAATAYLRRARRAGVSAAPAYGYARRRPLFGRTASRVARRRGYR